MYEMLRWMKLLKDRTLFGRYEIPSKLNIYHQKHTYAKNMHKLY